MITCNSRNSLKASVESLKENGTVGFIPTMGALHNGHISLVEKALTLCDFVVVSVFVNPTQFNNPEDLKLYPRKEEDDLKMLKESGVSIVFLPTVDEIYPLQSADNAGKMDYMPPLELPDFKEMLNVLEGEFRPGHFAGVIDVVARLFTIVSPNIAFFGEKDFQQLSIIRAMAKKCFKNIEIIGVETKREINGLAMSSRNQRLSTEGRERSCSIYKVLSLGKKEYFYHLEHNILKELNVISVETRMIEELTALNFEVEYLQIIDAVSLLHLSSFENIDPCNIRVCTALYCEGVRLIDNISFTQRN